jgi:17-hydroxy-3-oxo-4-pregnene-20-carboxyl-CoA lyase
VLARHAGAADDTGSVAFVITSTERAGATRAPVTIAAAGGAALLGQEIATDHYSADLSVMAGSAALARQLFGRDVKRPGVDVALIYDAFSPILFMQLEGLGFCGPGEARDFIADGNLGPSGVLPCNTNGASSARATSTAST